MNVALATQLMSHTTASALRTVVGTGQIVTNTALKTAEFIDFMNSLFDVLNSRVIKSKNNDSSALSTHNSHTIRILNKGLEVFSNLKKLGCKNPKPPCFRGMLLTIKSVLSLMNIGCEYILTSRLNQDTIENLFSSIRQRGGWNKNPTVRVFRSSLRLYCLQYLIEPPKSTSYDPDYDIVLDMGSMSTNYSTDEITVITRNDTEPEEKDEDEEDEEEDDDSVVLDPLIIEPVTLETCSQQYYAGYLALMCHKKFSCEKCFLRHCVVDSKLESASELLILHKTFPNVNIDSSSGLKVPSSWLMTILSTALNVYKKHFSKIAHKPKIVAKLLKQTKKCSNFSNSEINGCEEHVTYLLNTLFRVLIHKQCKWITSSLKTTSMEKVRILHHM
jgi:hypothetical protein